MLATFLLAVGAASQPIDGCMPSATQPGTTVCTSASARRAAMARASAELRSTEERIATLEAEGKQLRESLGETIPGRPSPPLMVRAVEENEGALATLRALERKQRDEVRRLQLSNVGRPRSPAAEGPRPR